MFKRFSRKAEPSKTVPTTNGGKTLKDVKPVKKWAKKYGIPESVLISLFQNGFDTLETISTIKEEDFPVLNIPLLGDQRKLIHAASKISSKDIKKSPKDKDKKSGKEEVPKLPPPVPTSFKQSPVISTSEPGPLMPVRNSRAPVSGRMSTRVTNDEKKSYSESEFQSVKHEQAQENSIYKAIPSNEPPPMILNDTFQSQRSQREAINKEKRATMNVSSLMSSTPKKKATITMSTVRTMLGEQYPFSAWYFGAVNREEAEAILMANSTDTFLVRPSATQDKCLCLSTYSYLQRKVMHWLITPNATGGYVIDFPLDRDIVYSTLNELIANTTACTGFDPPRQTSAEPSISSSEYPDMEEE